MLDESDLLNEIRVTLKEKVSFFLKRKKEGKKRDHRKVFSPETYEYSEEMGLEGSSDSVSIWRLTSKSNQPRPLFWHLEYLILLQFLIFHNYHCYSNHCCIHWSQCNLQNWKINIKDYDEDQGGEAKRSSSGVTSASVIASNSSLCPPKANPPNETQHYKN